MNSKERIDKPQGALKCYLVEKRNIQALEKLCYSYYNNYSYFGCSVLVVDQFKDVPFLFSFVAESKVVYDGHLANQDLLIVMHKMC